MPYVTLAEAREAASFSMQTRGLLAEAILRESRNTSISTKFDIFLSHSSMDKALVLGVKSILEGKGFTVYVDWVDDPQLNRQHVNKQTADTIRKRMTQSYRLIYLHTVNASLSKWCPWELGFFDGFTQPEERVYIFPLVSNPSEGFKGQEYLGLYRTVQISRPLTRNRQTTDFVVMGRAAA